MRRKKKILIASQANAWDTVSVTSFWPFKDMEYADVNTDRGNSECNVAMTTVRAVSLLNVKCKEHENVKPPMALPLFADLLWQASTICHARCQKSWHCGMKGKFYLFNKVPELSTLNKQEMKCWEGEFIVKYCGCCRAQYEVLLTVPGFCNCLVDEQISNKFGTHY